MSWIDYNDEQPFKKQPFIIKLGVILLFPLWLPLVLIYFFVTWIIVVIEYINKGGLKW